MNRTLVGFLGCVAACGGAGGTAESTARTSAPIVGGELDAADVAVGQMMADHGDWSGWCSGTLVSPTVFLTAAHCVEDADASTVVKVTFAADGVATNPDWKTASSVHVHPDWGTNYINYGHDCAVLVFDQPIAGITPRPYNHAPIDKSYVGRDIRVVGYGDTDGYDHTGSGPRRELLTQITDVYDGVIAIGEEGHTSCQGDSGGPTFLSIDGVDTVVGISSYGEPNCAGAGSYSRTELCADWIDTFTAAP